MNDLRTVPTALLRQALEALEYIRSTTVWQADKHAANPAITALRAALEQPEPMTLAERIDELVAQHGSLRALARVMECSPPYICRLRAGVTANPGPAVLRKLGLRRVVSYELRTFEDA
jgi:AraC-like DNA-binding protein